MPSAADSSSSKRTKAEDEKAVAAAEAEQTKKKVQERKAAVAEALRVHKEAMTEISFRLRRSRVWCDCGCPIHKPDCWIRGAREEILWSGADQYVSREELEWCNSIGGRVKKGHAF